MADLENMDVPPGMEPPDPDPMVQVHWSELQDLRQRAIPQEELDFFRSLADRFPALEAAVAERNTFELALSDMTQERNRLRSLLLSVVPNMEAFDADYPAATIARTAFQGDSPEEIAEKMALWDASRAQKSSEWNSLINHVRTQATV